MKRPLIISFLLTTIILLFPAISQAESYYYSVQGQLHDPDYPDGNSPTTYNLTGIMIIEESVTPSDGFEQILYQESLVDSFPIKDAILISDLETFSGNGNMWISMEWDLWGDGKYFDTSGLSLGRSEGNGIYSYADYPLTFRDQNGQSLPIEMYDTLPDQITFRDGSLTYDTEACHYCEINLMTLKKLRKVEPLPTPDLDQDGDVDGDDLSSFSKLFGVTNLENLSPPMPIYPYGGTLDNGCTDYSNPIEWEFSWSTITNATKYNIYVKSPDPESYNLIIDEIVTTNSYNFLFYFYVPDSVRHGWTWKVRSGNDQGQWSVWSLPRNFSVEPVNTDCQ